MIKVSSTKAFVNLPCAHAQYFDKEPDGSPGNCASVHGYDRTVKITFTGEVDDQGWIVPFGELSEVKKFLEYYFDHVTVFPANDPRIQNIPMRMRVPGEILGTMRVLPYGVSMEMSSLFIWEHINAFVLNITDGRCYVSKVECIEHERNSAYIEVGEFEARRDGYTRIKEGVDLLPKVNDWVYVQPKARIGELNGR